VLELAIRWSRLSALWIGRRARPSLPWQTRMALPLTGYPVRLGDQARARYMTVS
jgi:hypothetical protein